MKKGLVLEGGAMRGMYTSGVLDAFLDEKIEFDDIIGVSAGTLFGVNFLSKQRGRAIRYNKRFSKKLNYMGLFSLITSKNIINKKFAFYEVPFKLDVFDNEEYKKSNTNFYATVTNVETGKPEYILLKDVFKQMELLRATSAMPFVSEIVEVDGKKYLDGGVSDSIPFEKCISMGCDKTVVILTRDINYRKKPHSDKIYKMFYKKYPEFIKVSSNRYKVYNESVEKLIDLEEKGEVFVIRPSEPIGIGRLEKDPQKLQSVYELGFNDAKKNIEKLKKYLEK